MQCKSENRLWGRFTAECEPSSELPKRLLPLLTNWRELSITCSKPESRTTKASLPAQKSNIANGQKTASEQCPRTSATQLQQPTPTQPSHSGKRSHRALPSAPR